MESAAPPDVLAPAPAATWSRALVARVAASFVFRLSCYGIMVWLALWAEARPAPTLPDAVLTHVPYVEWIDRHNYLLWLVAYVPIALALLVFDAERFIRYMWTAGGLAIIRGLCIVATGLGPVRGGDLHAGMSDETRWRTFLELGTPLGFFAPDGGARVYLTKDLFFSGHTATTLLLLLYVWRFPKLRAPMLVAHVLVVASVFFSHLHYTIDVIGAYAVTLAVFALREGKLGAASPARA
ncbi:MAG: phosphatase PAP2-related protein [Myxococcota bacterium]